MQLRGDKECPFSGITKSGRVWRKVPENGARSVRLDMSTSQVAGGCTKKGQYNYKQTMFLFSGFCCSFVLFFIRAFIWVLCLREKRKEKRYSFGISTSHFQMPLSD